MRIVTLTLAALLALVACGRVEPTRDQPEPSAAPVLTTPEAPSPTPPREQTYTCADPHYGFSVSVPTDWQIVQLAPCEVRFLAPGGPELEPAAVLHGTVAEERFIAGVGVRGPLGAEDDVIDEAGWRSMLPNHAMERSVELVTTPSGQGRVFTLEHDREPEDRQDGATTWWAQHALIPAGTVTFELWAQVGSGDTGLPTPTLAAMLASFTRATDGPISAPPPVLGTSEVVEVVAVPQLIVQQTVQLEGVAWTLPQPEGVAPLVAANETGVLWVRFPPMLTTEGTRSSGMPPFAEEEYTLLFTPWRAEGGDLEQGAREIGRLPSTAPDGYQTITTLAPAGESHFWLGTYTLPLGAQNGGTNRVIQVSPDGSAMRELLQARGEGGGYFVRMAYGPRWLFWNSIDAGAARGEALLLDLVIGEQRPLDLGGNNWSTTVAWDAAGQFVVTRADDGLTYRVDPASGAVVAEGPFAEPCPTGERATAPGTTTVTVTLICGESARPVLRSVTAATGAEPLARAALEALLAGVTEEERAAGLSSWFGPETVGMLRSVTISGDGHVVVDFADFSGQIPNASTSAGSRLLLAQLDGTLFQFAEVASVTYQFEESCEAFWGWLQGSCTVRQRQTS